MSSAAFYATPRHKTLEIAPRRGAKHTATVIFMHGLGDQPLGWESIWSNFFLPQNTALDHVKFVFPSAPKVKTPMSPEEMTSWHQVDIDHILARNGPSHLLYSIEAQAEKMNFANLMRSVRDVDSVIQEEAELLKVSLGEGFTDTPEKRIIVAGFSQGAAMSLITGLTGSPTPEILTRETSGGKVKEEILVREGKAKEGWELGGVAALSGYIPRLHDFRKMYSSHARNTPLFWGHVKVDNVVAFPAGEASVQVIKELSGSETDIIDHSTGINPEPKKALIEMHQYKGTGHVYNEAVLIQLREHLTKWLTRVIPPL
ncbi:alpha beta-hydrolase [Coniophora puteana RWD-64-598 SS2]|uniref:Acyl-protein thioesterase 1 n=1 Tax=Coniophora puteana (strain RWD-64-598) TaxID=741705 RepID=A0A5M3M7P2_CONPW|nr:alpha beta-hydrolase [Coniophora puteana RWD-64-598 SS2]EIW75249.1 alpha beta-hydrolase [Coniophora puteana RWD-64-598 SS2]